MTTRAEPLTGKGTVRPRSRWGFALALAVLLGICLFATYRSALFRLERVQVAGNQRLSQAEVLAIVRAAPQLEDFTINLMAPILVSRGKAHQVINEAPGADLRAPLLAGLAAARSHR
ncbi:MAG: flagellar assembly protein FliW [Symbiobacteriaceae bacterium]